MHSRAPVGVARGGRVVPAAALVAAIALFALGMAIGVLERAHRSAASDAALVAETQAQQAVLENYFAEAMVIDLLTARAPALAEFYSLPGTLAERSARGGRVVADMKSAFAEVERLYPDRISEGCFIDRSGAEMVRVVRGKAATTDDLSPDERGNPFFAPTFALDVGEVYQSSPYVSQDTGEWVISNSTPLPTPDGIVHAIVHFEVTIEGFRQTAATTGGLVGISVVEAATGRVVIDSSVPQRAGAELGRPADARFRGLVQSGRQSGVTTVGGRRTAYQRIARSANNANNWYVVAVSPDRVAASYAGFGVIPIALLVGGVLLLGIAVWSFRASQRELERAAAEADRRSRVDALTGVFNRRHFADTLVAELSRSTRHDLTPGVLMLDVDHFKRINDTYGHRAGDLVLVELARRLDRLVREYDCLARFGGEEFAVLTPDIGGDEDLVRLAEKLRLAVSGEPFATGRGEPIAVTVSIGAARAHEGLWSPEGLVDAADRALYSAKRRGRDQTRTYDELSAEDHAVEEPEALRIAQALALSSSLREGMPALHSQQVADLSAAIAGDLGLSEAEVLRCRLGGWLHDVGKVAIPDRVLAKPGPLDAAEWELMRTHSAIGEVLTQRVAGLSEAARAVRHHHERYDGTGYPDELAGEDIPIEARIVAAADAYSAITSDRVYCPSRSREDAVLELEASAGTHLDPAVVAALVRVLESTFRPELPSGQAGA